VAALTKGRRGFSEGSGGNWDSKVNDFEKLLSLDMGWGVSSGLDSCEDEDKRFFTASSSRNSKKSISSFLSDLFFSSISVNTMQKYSEEGVDDRMWFFFKEKVVLTTISAERINMSPT
jgi:hypothetical protein